VVKYTRSVAVPQISRSQRAGRQLERYPKRYLRDFETEKYHPKRYSPLSRDYILKKEIHRSNISKYSDLLNLDYKKYISLKAVTKIQILLFPKGNKR